jgi:FtsP/CotA-like multicopper oxidase with cupredoxin domain
MRAVGSTDDRSSIVGERAHLIDHWHAAVRLPNVRVLLTRLVPAAVLLAVVLAAPGGGEEPAYAQGGGPGGGGQGGGEPQPGDPIFVPPESEGPLLQPPEITSQNGVLKADAELIRAGTPGTNRPILFGGLPTYSNPSSLIPTPQPSGARPPHFPLNFAAGYQFTTAQGKTYPAQFPGPTLRLEPGDTLDLTMRNRLKDEPTGPDPGPAGPIPEAAFDTNLHSHGMIVPPLGDSDNIYRNMEPGATDRTRIKIPATHHSGWDWYHPHRHGFVADQVYGGLAGSIEVGSPLDPWPQYEGKFQERLLALTAGIITEDPDTGLRVLDDPSPTADPGSLGPLLPYGDTWRKFVNGQYNPTITIRPGETEIWNFASMTRNANFNLGITDANGENPWSATILSDDGNSSNLQPRPTTLGLPVPYAFNGPTVLDEGARISMAVTAPTAPGTYYLVDDMTFKRRPQPSAFALATIEVEGAPVTEPPPVFPPTGTPDLFTAAPDHQRTWVFENDTSGETVKFPINGDLFPDGPITPLQVGQVEEWKLVNSSPVDHVFHIHQTDFAVISVNQTPVNYQNPFTAAEPNQYVSLRDTVNIPPGGNVVIRFRVSPELGKYVFHCHILPHEDAGMMKPVLALPNETQRRIALGTSAGKRNAVLVQDGNGRALERIRPGARAREAARRAPRGPRNARGGVVTATGDVNGDLTEDVIAGTPARAGPHASVSVYDGDTLERIDRFRPFPGSPRAGLSLATGDLDRDGKAEIVVGRVKRGASVVRVFRPDGALFRKIKGTLPGRLRHGVTVTSADFNGDNYDDVAIGAGRGSAPRVVGLDGFALGDTSRPPVTLFSFLAAGGGKSGVNLASGYYDPRTSPGLLANLITTPQRGRRAGKVQVWTPLLPEEHASSAGAGHTHSVAPRSTTSGSPRLMKSFRPLRRRVRGGLRLAVTFLGKQGVNALVAWRNPRKPRYVSIDDEGVVSDIPTPIRGRARLDERGSGREPRVAGPSGVEGAAGAAEASHEHLAADRQEPVAEPIEVREGRVGRPDHQRQDAEGDPGEDRDHEGGPSFGSLLCHLH